MALPLEQSDALIASRPLDGVESSRSYRIRVLLLAALGYAYIFAVLAALVAIVALLALAAIDGSGPLLAMKKLSFVLLGLAFMIVRSLWVRIDPPTGIVVERSDAPRLFDTIEEIRKAVDGPRVHRVLVTDDFNAAVAQVPRFGPFGWPRNYLLVGMPLMDALSPDQFRAVLAHEFGHLAGAHGSFAAWIYRARKTWAQLMERLQEQAHWGQFIFRRFFGWYIPYFMTYTYRLARAHEYDADRVAVRIAGSRSAADALTNSAIYGSYLSREFWPSILGRADDEPQPPAVCSEIRRQFAAGVTPEQASAWVNEALTEATGEDDTHPSLANRLTALGEPPRLPDRPHTSAAAYFLDRSLASLTEQLDRTWCEGIARSWYERHDEVQKGRARLAELADRSQREQLSGDELYERAHLTDELVGSHVAMPLYMEVLDIAPDHPEANFMVGRHLVQENDEAGLVHIEAAMQRDDEAILPGCRLIHAYLERNGRADEAQRYYERAMRQADVLRRAREERSRVRFSDTYIPHGLDLKQVQGIAWQLNRFPVVSEAYLVRKQVTHQPDRPLYILAISIGRPWYQSALSLRSRAKSNDREIAQQVLNGVELPGDAFVVPLNRENKKLRKIVSRIPDARIYSL